jgi:hypothetical protein
MRDVGHPRLWPGGGLGGGALVVEGEEMGEDLLVGEGGGPGAGGEDGFVEDAVGVGEPLGAGVVELGEGSGLEVFGGGSGWVEPGVAEADEFAGGVSDGADDGGVGFGGLAETARSFPRRFPTVPLVFHRRAHTPILC